MSRWWSGKWSSENWKVQNPVGESVEGVTCVNEQHAELTLLLGLCPRREEVVDGWSQILIGPLICSTSAIMIG